MSSGSASLPKSGAGQVAAAGEFILEGLWAHKRISRNEERGYFAERQKAPEPREPHGAATAKAIQLSDTEEPHHEVRQIHKIHGRGSGLD